MHPKRRLLTVLTCKPRQLRLNLREERKDENYACECIFQQNLSCACIDDDPRILMPFRILRKRYSTLMHSKSDKDDEDDT